MKLAQLERAEELIRLADYLVRPLSEVFARNGVDPMVCRDVEHLLADGQFYILLRLKRAEKHALDALEELDVQTAYLQEDLEKHLLGVQQLLEKIETEEHLRRDREALLSAGSAALSEGVLQWLEGKPEPG